MQLSLGIILPKSVIIKIHRILRMIAALSRCHHVYLSLKFVLIFISFFLIAWTSIDPDFGWHLQAGNYIRAHGIPSHDIFTYTARTFHWVDHEWGNDVIVSWFYSLGGYNLLAVIFASLWTAALFIVGNRTRLLVLLLAGAAMIPYAGIRPIAWTVFLLALLLKIISSKQRRLIWLVPLIFVIWANLHAGFIVGLAVLAYYMVRQRRKMIAVVLGLSFVATLVNPYGLKLYVEVARTTFDSSLHFQISEWAIFYLPVATYAFVALWGAGFWLLRRKKLTNWLDIGPIFFTAAMAATRNVPLFIVASIKDLDKYYEELKNQLPHELNQPRKRVLNLFALIVVGWLAYVVVTTFIPWPQRDAPYPTQAISYLRAHPCDGNLFNDYDYGGYLIWQLPSQPVYIDGRMPSWRNDSGQKYLDIYFQIISNKAIRTKQFTKYNIACVLLSRSSFNNQILNSLQKSGWQDVVKTNNSELLIRG
jgi:hypothetical protein